LDAFVLERKLDSVLAEDSAGARFAQRSSTRRVRGNNKRPANKFLLVGDILFFCSVRVEPVETIFILND
jgi:hypothetical protein